ncbi:MAG: hypothetical protein HQ475_08525 [SAR202 cluster bacterium]|nr:hypothetical protein [SAR202 cluster bacterium]
MQKHEELQKHKDEVTVAPPKFQSCQLVRIKKESELENPDGPNPSEFAMGKSGVIEMEGMVYVRNPDQESTEEGTMEQAYFVRIEGIGPVLTGEDWLEDAEPPPR